jgi:hypothetical protein
MRVSLALLPLLLALALPARAVEGQARPLTAVGQRQLDFGNLFPGVPATVLRTDALRSAAFEVRGTRFAEVRVDFTLPATLTAPGGRVLTLAFAAGDGGYAQTNAIGAATAFDPRVPLVTRLANTGRLFIWLGGTALPSPTQAAATYTGTITLTSAYTGN